MDLCTVIWISCMVLKSYIGYKISLNFKLIFTLYKTRGFGKKKCILRPSIKYLLTSCIVYWLPRPGWGKMSPLAADKLLAVWLVEWLVL